MAVGARERIDVHSHELTLRPGDVLLLCSDGLHGPVEEAELAEALAAQRGLPELAGDLIARAKDHGGPDNITAVLLEHIE